jgi:hypothetical protein
MSPLADMIFDARENLYGTTASGGSTKWRRLQANPKLGRKLDGERPLQLQGYSDGASPVAGLIFDQAGNLYGRTLAGGFYNFGVVFKMTPNGSGEWNNGTRQLLHQFANEPKAYSAAGLTFDAAGNLYGTTLPCASPLPPVLCLRSPRSLNRRRKYDGESGPATCK